RRKCRLRPGGLERQHRRRDGQTRYGGVRRPTTPIRPAEAASPSAEPTSPSGADEKRRRGRLLGAEGGRRPRTGNIPDALSNEQERPVSRTDGAERGKSWHGSR
ncbi:hypothetical protein BIW11_11459, partial [Tropilaelaps mercedesae]